MIFNEFDNTDTNKPLFFQDDEQNQLAPYFDSHITKEEIMRGI